MHITVSLSDDIECLLKSGQEVNFNTPFLENKVLTDISVPISQKLGIEPDKIFNYLKKFVGDAVEKKELLAEKKGVIGSRKVFSEFKGIIKEINHSTGEIIIATLTSHQGNINAYFIGEVVEVDKKYVKLKVQEVHEYGLKKTNSDFGGEAFYYKDAANPIHEQQTESKIMITGSLTPYLITKTEAMGIKGFVTTKKLPDEVDLVYAMLKNPDDLDKILGQNLPYCLINKEYSKIYFYK